jgi:hypothetical protein
MAKGQPKQQGDADTEMKWLAAAIVAALALWVLWRFARKPILWVAFGINLAEIQVIQALRGLGERGSQIKDYMLGVFDGRLKPQDVTWEEFHTVLYEVGRQAHLVLFAVVLALAMLIMMKMKGMGYRRVLSLAGGKGQGPSFAHYQAQYWKVVAVGANFDPDADDERTEPAATPMEWMRANKLELDEGRVAPADDARAAFARQLGDPWQGVMKASVPAQAIAVLCALSHARDKRKTAFKEGLAQALAFGADARAMQKAKAIVQPFLEDKKLMTRVDKVGAKHAYVNTALFGILDWSRRKSGVLPSAEFLWLKRADRSLWYALNNCGRRAYLVEGAGAVSHFFAERVSGVPLADPYLDEAVTGLEEYLEEQGIMNVEEFFRASERE